MVTTLSTGVGLALPTTETLGHDTWIDTNVLEFREGGTRIGLKVPANGAQVFYHRTDGGRTSVKWDHTNFIIPSNYGAGSNGEVKVKYAVSNTAYDVGDSGGRASIDLLMSGGFLTEANMQAVDESTGRYRYIIFQLNTDLAQDSFVQAAGVIELLKVPVEPVEQLQFTIDGNQVPQTLEVIKGGQRKLSVCVFSRPIVTGGKSAVDLTGSTLTLKIGKSFASGTTLATVAGTITDAENGEVEFQLDSTDTNLDVGKYIAQIVYDNVTETKVDKLFTLHIKDVFAQS